MQSRTTDIEHQAIISLMKLFEYDASDEGMCGGVIALALAKFLGGKLNNFDDNIKLIQEIYEQEFTCSSSYIAFKTVVNYLGIVRPVVDLDAFLRLISICHSPEKFFSILNVELKQVDVDRLLNILFHDDFITNPVSLRFNWMGIYELDELSIYYSKIDVLVKNSNEDFSFLLENEYHRILVIFDKHSASWRLIDPNFLLNVNYVQKNLQDLLASLFKSFDTTNNIVTFSTSFYTTQDKAENIDRIIRCITALPEHVDLHQIDHSRVNLKTSSNVDLLYMALSYLNLKMAKQLISVGADVNSAGFRCESPIFLALKLNSVKSFDLLLKNGADIHVVKNGWSPITFVIYCGMVDFLEVMVKRGIQLPAFLSDGMSLMELAKRENQPDVVKFLEDYESGRVHNRLELKANIKDYISRQMQRMPKDCEKRKSLKEIKEKLNHCHTRTSIEKLIQSLNAATASHQDTGAVGFFKGTWFRKPSSFTALQSMTKENQKLLKLS